MKPIELTDLETKRVLELLKLKQKRLISKIIRLEREVRRLNVSAEHKKDAMVVCKLLVEHYADGQHRLDDIAQLAARCLGLVEDSK